MSKPHSQKTPDLIVNVESRKGGVGKTTAALCLGRLLRRKGYAVLVLDLDITGTNAAYIARSPFWINELHVVREAVGDDTPPINLIRLFDQRLMAGKAIPEFSTKRMPGEAMFVDLAKVNVLGSQIYTTTTNDAHNRGETQNKTATCIERPGILFDDLHTLWLAELVSRLTNNFVRAASSDQNAKVAVIMDNSPGFVGIAPATNDWLTDLGPQAGKFLIVTSLDVQDLRACDRAVSALHGLYTSKWRTSRVFIEAGSRDVSIAKDQESFFLRLATTASDSPADDPLFFYRQHEVHNPEGQLFAEHPSKYVAAIVNRVPRAVKTGRLAYDLRPIFDGESIFRELLVGNGEKDWRKRMICYDEYIENQFLLESLQRNRRHSDRRLHRLIDSLDMAERELQSTALEGADNALSLLETDHERLRTQLSRVNEVISSACRAVDDAGFGHLVRLIHDEWFPGSVVPDFQSVLSRFLSDTDLPTFEPISSNSDTDLVNQEAREFAKNLKKRVLVESRQIDMPGTEIVDEKTRDLLAGALSGLACLALTSPSSRTNIRPQVTSAFAAVLSVELMHWVEAGVERSSPLGVQQFLSQESVSTTELRRRLESFQHLRSFRLYAREITDADFGRFYKACTRAQARLIDFAADARFLLQLLSFTLEGELEKGALFPFLSGIADDVILHKRVSHEEAPAKMSKTLRTAEYFRDFDIILKKVLADWGVDA